MRADGRSAFEHRPVSVELNYVVYPEGSVLICFGNTKVVCNVSLEDRVPNWLVGRGKGWVTAEYGMLPRSTHSRMQREARSNRPNSRSLEISRLIGRSLRAVVDLGKLGERSLTVDCDVIQADGGTRTASITGAYLALELAFNKLVAEKKLSASPLLGKVAAISVGVVDGEVVVDLNYDEDSRAAVDMNIVMDDQGRFIELQGTAEKTPFDPQTLQKMLDGGQQAIESIFAKLEQNKAE